MTRLPLLAAALGVLFLPLAMADEPRPFVPTAQYDTRTVDGWTVRVNRRLLADGDQADLGREALPLLEAKLREVSVAIPAPALAELRRVPIWLGVDDGHAPCAEYHPSRDWLVTNGFNPDKARAVELGNARRFVDWSKDQPSMVLHELAHGYHDRVLGYDQPEVVAALKRVRQAGLYDDVAHVRGGSKRAYALTNPPEFFAELSEAYFGSNDFFPYGREELRRHDPESFALLERLWSRPAPQPAP